MSDTINILVPHPSSADFVCYSVFFTLPRCCFVIHQAELWFSDTVESAFILNGLHS